MADETPPPQVPPGTDLEASRRVSNALEDALARIVSATHDPSEGLIVAIVLTHVIAEAAARDYGEQKAIDMVARARSVAMRANIEPLLASMVCVELTGSARGDA